MASSSPFDRLRQQHLDYSRSLLPGYQSRLDWTREDLEDFQKSRLLSLVWHAKTHSRYYSRILEDLNMEDLHMLSVKEIAQLLPTISKEQVAEHWDELCTDPRLTKAAAEEHLAKLLDESETNPYLFDHYLIAATGGTSGTPGLFVWDWELSGDALCQCERLALEHEGRHPTTTPKRTAHIAARALVHLSAAFQPMIPAMDPEREVEIIPADLPLSEMIEQLNAYQPDRLLVYGSLVGHLAEKQVQGELSITLNAILTMAEPLEDAARETAQQAWPDCQVYQGYCTTESGALAVEGPDHTGMILCEDSMYLEVVNDEGQPDPDGERVLVTRFEGRTFPLLRYELTDSLEVADPPGKGLAPAYRRLLDVQGRNDVVFEYEGHVKVLPSVFCPVLVAQDAILEYQVQQTDKGAHVLCLTKADMDTAAVAKALAQKLAAAGVDDPQVTVQVVDELPRHVESAKVQRFVPLSS